jgi:undecaprenyl-diphosphatase
MRPPARIPVAACGLACASFAALVFLLMDVTHFHHLARLDTRVRELMAMQPAWLVLLSTGLHYLFSFFGILSLTAAVAFLLWRRIGRKEAVMIPGMTLLGAGLNAIIKFLVARPRPTGGLIFLADSAFPSGHTTSTTIFFAVMCVTLLPRLASGLHRALMISAAIFIVGLVGFSRLSLQVHWLTDVLAGMVLGGGVVSIAALAGAFATKASPAR